MAAAASLRSDAGACRQPMAESIMAIAAGIVAAYPLLYSSVIHAAMAKTIPPHVHHRFAVGGGDVMALVSDVSFWVTMDYSNEPIFRKFTSSCVR